MTRKTTVAILGRPNVGKSTLFNAFTKSRDALVHNRPGVTRDVLEGARGAITFLDTAGLEDAKGGIAKDSTDLALAAARRADTVLFIVDARSGLHPMDAEWARIAAKLGASRVMLLANKCESKKAMDNLPEFYKLGFGAPFPVSAEHNIGLDEVLLGIAGRANQRQEAKDDDGAKAPCIAIMGQPNVGKSTLINAIAKEKRVLVRDEPGITRDAVRLSANCLGRDIRIIDTAGLRRKSKVDDDIETLAALKALGALEEADAAILVVDASKDIESSAVKIAERIYDAGKVLCVALNKWDLVADKNARLKDLGREFTSGLSQIISPLMTPISAMRGDGVESMMRKIFDLMDKSNAHAPTSLVNRVVEKLVADKPPPMSRLKRPMKIKFASHAGLHPNVVSISVGGASDIPDSYTRYLRRGIAKELGWESLPVIVRYVKDENPFK